MSKEDSWFALVQRLNCLPITFFLAGKNAKDYEKLEKELKPLRENPREKGNIMEIVADWPKDEVWEMVEAKVEQIIELREMGEM